MVTQTREIGTTSIIFQEALLYQRRILRSSETQSSSPSSSSQNLQSTSNQRPGNLYNATSFDTNVVLILAALLCLLICALAINSIIRCALRCMSIESVEEVSVRLANTGLRKNALKALPTVVYGKVDLGMEPSSECPICLGEFVEGEIVRVLPKCNHGFHVACIDTWLLSHSSCPTCRESLLSMTENISLKVGGGDLEMQAGQRGGLDGGSSCHDCNVLSSAGPSSSSDCKVGTQEKSS